jgi:hypothetical protein
MTTRWELLGDGIVTDEIRDQVEQAVVSARVHGRDLVKVLASIESSLR